jgi:glycosyltransferase involved in cell wall biosynthesis
VGADGKPLDQLPRILIATPYYDNSSDIYDKSIDQALFGSGEYFISAKFRVSTSAVDVARSDAIEAAIKQGFDYVFFADADMGFPPGTLVKLLAAMETQADERVYITSGVYNLRRYGFVLAVYHLGDNALISVNDLPDSGFKINDGIYMADAVGTGCMLIDVKLFSDHPELDHPYFRYRYAPMGSTDPKIHRWSEDLDFGVRCSEAGVHVFVHTGVICKHELRDCAVYETADGPTVEIGNQTWRFKRGNDNSTTKS